MRKQFVAVAGYTDGGKFISASQVAKNYELPLDKCVLAGSDAMLRGMRHAADQIVLHARTNGKNNTPQQGGTDGK